MNAQVGATQRRLAAAVALALLALACGGGTDHGSGVVVRVVMESYGGGPFPVVGTADDPQVARAMEDLSCRLSDGACAVEFSPPDAPATVQFRLAVDSTVSDYWRARVIWGEECASNGTLTVQQEGEYVCRAGLWSHIGLSPHWYEEANITCTSSGVVCTPRHVTRVTNHAPFPVSLSIFPPGSLCSSLIFRTYIDGALVGVIYPADPAANTGSQLPVPQGTTRTLEVEAELLPGGCLGTDLREWHALLKIIGDVTVTP